MLKFTRDEHTGDTMLKVAGFTTRATSQDGAVKQLQLFLQSNYVEDFHKLQPLFDNYFADKSGLYDKFIVTRTDGKSGSGCKHDGCSYFVLDMDHDEHALAAVKGYIHSLEASGEHLKLAADLRAKYLT